MFAHDGVFFKVNVHVLTSLGTVCEAQSDDARNEFSA